MCLHQGLDNRQAKARAAPASRPGSIRPPESLEQPLLILRRDARPGIATTISTLSRVGATEAVTVTAVPAGVCVRATIHPAERCPLVGLVQSVERGSPGHARSTTGDNGMAYRFLLEVPESLAADASVAVALAGDAQVLVERNSHGLGFDDPYVDLTVAAHSLGVIGILYDWAQDIGVKRPENRNSIRIVLLNGGRISLHDVDQAALVAAVRRDQPWVERSVPKIGEHERNDVTESLLQRGKDPLLPEANRSLATATAAPATTIQHVEMIETDEELTSGGITYAVIPVLRLEPAERFYNDVFGLQLQQRLRRSGDGWEALDAGYHHGAAEDDNIEADLVFLHNGPLNIALQRAGRAARLDYSRVSNEIGVAVDAATGSRLKAIVLMRGYTMLTSTASAFAFRDPFGVVWDVHPAS